MNTVIDAHSHYIPPEIARHTSFFKVHWSDIDRQLMVMDECGIEKTLLLYPTSDAHLSMGGWHNLSPIYNQALRDVVRKFPKRFIGAGILPIDQPDTFPDALKRMEDYGLKVVSLASSYDGVYLDAKIFYPVYEFVQNKKMLIHVHPQIINPIGEDRVKDPLLTPVLEYMFDVSMCFGKMMMSGTFLDFPDAVFIFAHYGGVLPFVKERFDNTYLMLRGRGFVKDLSKVPSEYFKNLYFDTSGSKSLAALQCMLEAADAGRILFGSDFPANQNIQQSLAAVRGSPICDEDKQKIMRNNLLAGF